MQDQQWINEFPGAIIVCDTEGIILSMNDKAIKTFESDGGENLIGTNVLDCHPEPSKTTFKELLRTQKKNIYTIEKNGVKKLIYQAPWYRNGEYAGFVELSLEIPFEMPHFVRR
ncbi:MAG: PAS domain-containing protein [Ignavibacteriales bacterium]|nr:PAS domain-containing protein [Ignavibacteriales bacterium]